MAGQVGIGLLYVSKERERVQEWVAEDERFAEESEKDGLQALGRFFAREAGWQMEGLDNKLCEMIWRFG